MARRRGGRETVEVIPSARRLVQSLRDVGYDFVHAVADLIDNSVTGNASRVDIDVRFKGPESWVRIADNGYGMSGNEITEAMRYGSVRDYEIDDLGKFGLGLKTASMSQCRRLTVASRISPERRRVEVRELDLDYVEKSDRWEVFAIDPADRDELLLEPLEKGPGTVVLWNSLDRVLNYKVPWGERAKNGLLSLAERLDLHLGMVFHRFLSGEAGRRPRLKMFVNGTPVEPWDPFARDERSTEALTEHEFEVATPTGPGIARLSPFVLPPREMFSSQAAFERLGGPRRWNAQQGFYVYRANRMIQSGGWSYMRTADEHTKLARAALDFFPDLDSAFEINVAKVRVTFPDDLRVQLKPVIDQLVRRAQEKYRQKPGGGKGAGLGGGTSGRGRGSSGRRRRGNPYRIALEGAANRADEKEALKQIVKELRVEDPDVARELGW